MGIFVWGICYVENRTYFQSQVKKKSNIGQQIVQNLIALYLLE